MPDFVRSLPVLTETTDTFHIWFRDRAGKGGGGGMAGARATLGIVRGGTGTEVSESERSERWGRAQRDGSGRPARSPIRS